MKLKETATCFILTLSLVNTVGTFGQSGGAFQIGPSVISSGGGASSGGAFVVNSTIGQPMAGTNSTGVSFSLLSGFWASAAATEPGRTPFDFDGEGKTDIGIFRPAPTE